MSSLNTKDKLAEMFRLRQEFMKAMVKNAEQSIQEESQSSEQS